VNNELEMMWKEVVVAKLEVLYRHFHGKAEEKHEIHQPV
jgi:hypothetical protein